MKFIRINVLLLLLFFLINIYNLHCQESLNNQYTILNEFDEIKISISGNIILKNYFGPPNYGETPEIDIKEKHYVLKTNKIITFSNGIEVIKVKEFQLIFLTKDFAGDIDPNKNYLVIGNAFYAQTGHHHTPIIISVNLILIN